MWRNRPVEQFVSWLHNHNLLLPGPERAKHAVGLYGMGVQCFWQTPAALAIEVIPLCILLHSGGISLRVPFRQSLCFVTVQSTCMKASMYSGRHALAALQNQPAWHNTLFRLPLLPMHCDIGAQHYKPVVKVCHACRRRVLAALQRRGGHPLPGARGPAARQGRAAALRMLRQVRNLLERAACLSCLRRSHVRVESAIRLARMADSAKRVGVTHAGHTYCAEWIQSASLRDSCAKPGAPVYLGDLLNTGSAHKAAVSGCWRRAGRFRHSGQAEPKWRPCTAILQLKPWGAMLCAGRFGKDAVDYAKGLAMGHSSCEQQALKEMLDLLSRCDLLCLCGHLTAKTTLSQCAASQNLVTMHFFLRPM